MSQIAFFGRLFRRTAGLATQQLLKFPEPCPALVASLHTTCSKHKDHRHREWLAPMRYNNHNDRIYPPIKEGEERRAAIRGLTVDEALKQLTFCDRHGAAFVKEVLLEAQEMAVKEHNVEYKSNLWVAESFVSKGVCVKGLRRHARCRWGKIEWKFSHYYIKLEEGSPPEFFYQPILTGEQKLQKWIEERRNRTIRYTL